MKFLTLLALVPFFALSYEAPASAMEEASAFPWNEFTRDVEAPTAATQLLATFHLSNLVSPYSLDIASCGNNLQAVKLVVQNAPVTIASFGFRFADGATRDFNVNQTFSAGTDSGWIDLSAIRTVDQRCPTKVYAKANSTGRATVLIYGNTK